MKRSGMPAAKARRPPVPPQAKLPASRPVTPAAAAERKRRKMSSSTPDVPAREAFPAAVITVSDSCARGERHDLSGPAVAELLNKHGFHVAICEIVPDDSIRIQNL